MAEQRLFSIRGATCAENTAESITKAVGELMSLLFASNGLKAEDLVNIQFTVTSDLDALNPATALRKSCTGLDISHTALFCSQEAEIKGMLPRVIRVMVTCYMDSSSMPRGAYINGAQVLRPDLAGERSL